MRWRDEALGLRIAELRNHWALVTGSSSGIGAGFCRQLAAAGVNLVMVARRKSLLDELAAELAARHGVRTLVLVVDLAQMHSAEAVKAATDAAGIRIRLLVNNAASGPWGSFERNDGRSIEQVVQLASATPMALCRAYAQDLRSFGTAGVVNVSSPAALQPVPYIAVYSAAKACLHQFSLALHGEWKAYGVTVQTLLPAPTATEFDAKGGAYASDLGARRKPAAAIVADSLSGLATGRPVITNSAQVALQRAFAGLAPFSLLIRQVGRMFVPPPGR